MSGREVTEWAAYERVAGPLGAERLDALAGLVSFYVLRAAGAKKVRLSDVMPQWSRPEPMDWRVMERMMTDVARRAGADMKEAGDGEPS